MQVAQKVACAFVNFVHTKAGVSDIIMAVNPNTLYSFCYTP